MGLRRRTSKNVQRTSGHVSGVYTQVGLALLIAGLGLVVVALFLLNSVPLTSLGSAAVILSLIAFGLERSTPRLSPRMSLLLMEAGQDNIAALVEEMGSHSKAFYLPSSMTKDRPRAFIAADAAPDFSSLPTGPAYRTGGQAGMKALSQRRLIVHYGSDGHDTGILVATPGSGIASLLEERPGPTPGELEAALSKVLLGELDAARGVIVQGDTPSLTVRLSGVSAEAPALACQELLGSPLASIVASVAAEALDRPVVIVREERHGDSVTIELDSL